MPEVAYKIARAYVFLPLVNTNTQGVQGSIMSAGADARIPPSFRSFLTAEPQRTYTYNITGIALEFSGS